MKAVGIIAEYNPFHNGHQYHVEKAKELTTSDYAVVVMSGNFVQRGTPSVTDKYTRTAMALSSGADLVFELPVRYACGSAEFFSMGAVALLQNLGITDTICFGSECGDISLLALAADILSEEPPAYRRMLNQLLKQGHTFPFARNLALLECCKKSQYAAMKPLLASPNNILGMEYLKALNYYQSPMTAHTLKREGLGYHDTLLHPFASASAIRSSYQEHSLFSLLKESIPENAFSILQQAELKTFPVTEHDLSPFLFYKLLEASDKDLSIYQDISSDLGRRIQTLFSSYTSYEEFAKALKSRQYTRTRINRALLHLLLNICSFSLKDVSAIETIPYLRLLGLKKDASHLLRSASFHPVVPLITKVADGEKLLPEAGKRLFREDLYASRLYQYIVYHKFGYSLKDDYRTSPIIM